VEKIEKTQVSSIEPKSHTGIGAIAFRRRARLGGVRLDVHRKLSVIVVSAAMPDDRFWRDQSGHGKQTS
jgi:hypothetical protein